MYIVFTFKNLVFFRYSYRLKEAQRHGIKKGFFVAVATALVFIFIFVAMGIAFWSVFLVSTKEK